MNSEQIKIFNEFKIHFDDVCNSKTVAVQSKSILVDGGPGTGKTFLAQAITLYIILKSKENHVSVDEFIVAAPTAFAACMHIKATTIYSAFGLGINHNKLSSIQNPLKHMLIKSICNNIRLLIIDEISMVTSKLFMVLNERLHEMRQNNDVFGGVNVLLLGDFLQLKPPAGEFLIDANLILSSPIGEIFRSFKRTKL